MEWIMLILAPLILWYIVSSVIYRRTDYYIKTQKSFGSVRFNKGNYGEYLTYKYLRSYEADGARFLYNCYLPKDNGETTEVDVMMVHKSGVYVFESKNYSGWIFGSEYQKNWTQTLLSGRKVYKEHFLNPIIQNKVHIKWLKKQIGDKYPVHSVIVFSERCTLKKIDLNNPDIYVIKRNSVMSTVEAIKAKAHIMISQEQVEDIYNKLFSFTQVGQDVKEKHIQDIKNSHTDENISYKRNVLICPKCGGELKIRLARRGAYAGNQFYGCTNYPKCRYIRNIQ